MGTAKTSMGMTNKVLSLPTSEIRRLFMNLRLGAMLLAAAALPSAISAQPTEEKPAAQLLAHELSSTFRSAVEKVRPSIVFIETHGGPRRLLKWSKHESREGTDGVKEPKSDSRDPLRDFVQDVSGTGVVFDARGYVLTCSHLVEAADGVFVRLPDGRRLEAIKVLTDPLTDLAVVQIEPGQLSVATLAEKDELRVGDWVISVGNPYSLGLSVSAGIVSGLDRQMSAAPRAPLIQTDAASNPGNSGGALINLDGQVVGICEGGYGSHEGFQGIGFAIPISLAKRIAGQLIEQGRVQRVALGYDTETVASEVAEHLGIAPGRGLIVTDVKPGSSAAQAGLNIGDVITRFDGTRVRDTLGFLGLIEKAVPEREVTFTVFRKKRSMDIIVRPTELPNRRNNREPDAIAPKEPTGYRDLRLGITLDKMSSDMASELGYVASSDGLLVTHVQPQSTAAKKGICAGMVVYRIDDEPIRTVEDYERVTTEEALQRGILVLIGTPERKHFIVLRI